MLYLIIKLSDKRDGKLDPPNLRDDQAIKERACGNWKTSLPTLYKTKHCLVLYKKHILKEYVLGDDITLIRAGKDSRVRLHITKEIKDSKYIGKILDYRTANPLSVLDSTKFKYISEE